MRTHVPSSFSRNCLAFLPARHLAWLAFLSFGLILLSPASAQQQTEFPYPPDIKNATAHVYKVASQTELKLYVFAPPGLETGERRPAIIFFFGGGWSIGSPQQFEAQCRYFSDRGMVAITVDYRVRSRQGVMPAACIEDACSAVRWVRQHAAELSVDPGRIVVAGGSAGGHLAAATTLFSGFDAAGEDLTVSTAANALVLFNPALVLAPVDGMPASSPSDQKRMETMKALFGVKDLSALVALSPFHHLRSGLPPTLILHGQADTSVPFGNSELFAGKMKELGNRCELAGYAGQEHGFFNLPRAGGEYFRLTLKEVDRFLQSIGYLPGSADPSPR